MSEPTAEQVSTWGAFSHGDDVEKVAAAPSIQGLAAPGVFLLSPAVMAITFVDGLWKTLNEELGTRFDQWEGEELTPEISGKAADCISRFADVNYEGGEVRRQVGTTGAIDKRPIFAAEDAVKIRQLLHDLARFLREASQAGIDVTVSL